MQVGTVNCFIISAGIWYGDGGAALGVMPKELWKKLYKVDERNRIQLALNLLLIQSARKNILVDTGIGNKLPSKLKNIYSPSKFSLPVNLGKIGLETKDIDIVILTHLHFDHSGGVVSKFNDKYELTFPNAVHIIQRREWEMAKDPDELNAASYNFEQNLALLENSGNYRLIEKDHEVVPGITCEHVGGHSVGMQVVRIESNNKLAYYAGDIIPLAAQRHLNVTSSSDICRKDTFIAKKKILKELRTKNGYLFLNHDVTTSKIHYSE